MTMVPVVSMSNVVHVGSSAIRRTVIYDVTGEYICSDCGKIEAFKKRVEVDLFYMTHAGRSFADAVKDELGPSPTCACSLQRKGLARCMIGRAIQRGYRSGFRKEWNSVKA